MQYIPATQDVMVLKIEDMKYRNQKYLKETLDQQHHDYSVHYAAHCTVQHTSRLFSKHE